MSLNSILLTLGAFLMILTLAAAIYGRGKGRRPVPLWLWPEIWLTLFAATQSLRVWLSDDPFAAMFYVALFAGVIACLVRVQRSRQTSSASSGA